MFWKKKNKETEPASFPASQSKAGADTKIVPVHAFALKVPANWQVDDQGGKIKFTGPDIRVTLTLYGFDKADFPGLEGPLAALREGYGTAGYSPASEMVAGKTHLRQMLALEGENCCLITASRNEYEGDVVVMNMVFNTYTSDEMSRNMDAILYLLDNILKRA